MMEKIVEEKKYVLYIHTNKINNKKYVGITSQDPSRRWGSKGQKYIECPYFWSAIQKYGWENFDHEIVCENQTREEACEMEISIIEKLNTCNPEYGYNLSAGGTSPDPELSRKVWQNESTKQHIIQRMREAWQDPEKRKRRSDAAKERWSNPEFRERVVANVTQACKHPVRCIETEEVFDTIKAAAEKYGVDSANITRSAKTHYRCGGFHWEYVDCVL